MRIATATLLVLAACGGASDGSTQSTSDPTAPAAPPAAIATPPSEAAPTTPAVPALTATKCFEDLTGPTAGMNYDQFGPKIAKSCSGTNHQVIAGVEKVVYLGDSVTVGTPPTLPNDFYRLRLETTLKKKFPSVTFASCAKWGAQMNDLRAQLDECFPSGTETKKTLVVMTVGGNDIHSWAKSKSTPAAATTKADEAIAHLRAAIDWIRSPAHFTNGSFVVTANVYEFTDTSGDLTSCPTATLAGMSGAWLEGAPAVIHFEEQIMKTVVETKTDMIFLFERFCGHGFKRGDASLQCYRGPNTDLWFDLTCIHPNPKGHAEIAKLFENVISGE